VSVERSPTLRPIPAPGTPEWEADRRAFNLALLEKTREYDGTPEAQGLGRANGNGEPHASPAERLEQERQKQARRPPQGEDASSAIVWPGSAEDYEPPAQLVSGLLMNFGIAEIFGPPSCGKTALGFDLGASIARGIPFRGRTIAGGGGLVAYVAAENPGSAKLRLKAYIRANPDSLEMPFALVCAPLNLGSEESIARLLRIIGYAETKSGRKCVAVVVDTLAAAMSGMDENGTKDMGFAVDGLARIRDAIAGLVIVVHHSGKDAARGARGNSALPAAVDTEIAVSGLDRTRTATVSKQRDLPSGATFDFTLVPVTIGFDATTRESITAVVVQHGPESTASAKRRPIGKAQLAILNAMEAGEPGRIWTQDDIKLACAAAGVTHRNTRKHALLGLGIAGFIRPTVGGYCLP
jgi:hypothetical protein